MYWFIGPYIGISDAIQEKTFFCDPLSPILSLLFTQHYQEYIISVAKFFVAYKKTLDTLAEYYKNPTYDDPSQLSFPYIRVFKSLI